MTNTCCDKCKGFMEKTRFTLSCMECTCHQSEKPQPENWEIEFDKMLREDHEWKCQAYAEHVTCCIDEDGEKYIPIKSFISSLLSRQKEQMLEVLSGMKSNIKFTRKMVLGGQYTLDSCQGCNQTWSSCVCVERNVGYNSALSDVEEKWKDL